MYAKTFGNAERIFGTDFFDAKTNRRNAKQVQFYFTFFFSDHFLKGGTGVRKKLLARGLGAKTRSPK